MSQIKLTDQDNPYDCLNLYFNELVETFRKGKVTFKVNTHSSVNDCRITIDVFPETNVNTFNFKD